MSKLFSTLILLFALSTCSIVVYGQLPGYNFYKNLTIQDIQVNGVGAHNNFPVLINHVDADLRFVSNAGGVENMNGFDIQFTSSDGITLLDHQLEDYDPVSGAITVWVKIPSLNTSGNTTILMYYGNSSIIADPSLTSTWDNNYKGVWHLNNDNFDATSNTNNLTSIGTTNNLSAPIASGKTFSLNESLNGGIQPELQILGDLTVESWVNLSSLQSGNTDNVIISSGMPVRNSAADNHSFKLNITRNRFIRTFWEYGSGTNETSFSSVTAPISAGNWHHVAFTRNSITKMLTFYFDGDVLGSSIPYGNNPDGGVNAEIRLGEHSVNNDLDGSLDETRISNSIRSNDWLKTSYNSMKNPSSFYLVGQEICLGPKITICENDTSLFIGSNCETNLGDFTGGITATDPCQTGLTYTQKPISGTILPVGTTTIWLYATDLNAKKDSCSFILTLKETEAPIISCPNDSTLSCPGIVNGIGPSNPIDNCGIDSTSYVSTGATILSDLDDISGQLFNNGITTVTYKATDNSGNISTCDFKITIVDTIIPIITCLNHLTINTSPVFCSTIVNGIAPLTLSDNCNLDSVYYDLIGTTIKSGSGDDASGESFNLGNTTVLYTATDLSGNTNSCSLVITIADSIVPSIACPSNILDIQVSSSGCDTIISNLTPVYGDNCAIDSIKYILSGATLGQGLNDASGVPFNVGKTDVTYIVKDNAKNSSSCDFHIIVIDTIKPLITCPDSSREEFTPNASCNINLQGITPIYSDNCAIDSVNYVLSGATLGQGLNDASGIFFNVGKTEILYTATDTSGNSKTCTFHINVMDTISPEIECPNQLREEFIPNTSCDIKLQGVNPIYYDNCVIDSVSYTLSKATLGHGLNDASGVFFNVGKTEILYTATDTSGNSSSCTFIINVMDTIKPSITCPSNIVICDTSVIIPLPIYSDNCAVKTITNDFNASENASDIYPQGSTIINWTVTDSSGNSNSCLMTVNTEVPLSANAGKNQTLVGLSTTNLSAETPSNGSGTWVNTNGFANISNINNPISIVNKLATGENIFEWTVSKLNCEDAVDEVLIKMVPLVIPNGFSPNNDGDNDFFAINGLDLIENEVRIFNRWGVELFHAKNYQNNWNGKNSSARDLPEDTYFYSIKIPKIDKELSGFIVLKR